MKKKILIIVSHPDDEVLGCGGAIDYHLKNNDNVYIYFTHEGSSYKFKNQKDKRVKKEIKIREDKAKKLAKDFNYTILGFGNNFNLESKNISHLKNVKKIIELINLIKPDVIYTHNNNDVNPDHILTHKFVITACRPINFLVNRILLFEVPSSTDWNLLSQFNPNIFIKIDINKKLRMLDYYKSEMRDVPHPRSNENIKALSRFRGGQSGFNFAEAFVLYRENLK